MRTPGDGLPPYELDRVLGMYTTKALAEDESLSLESLKRE
jgi:N-acetylneuraminate synthase/sialic acid synthase